MEDDDTRSPFGSGPTGNPYGGERKRRGASGGHKRAWTSGKLEFDTKGITAFTSEINKAEKSVGKFVDQFKRLEKVLDKLPSDKLDALAKIGGGGGGGGSYISADRPSVATSSSPSSSVPAAGTERPGGGGTGQSMNGMGWWDRMKDGGWRRAIGGGSTETNYFMAQTIGAIGGRIRDYNQASRETATLIDQANVEMAMRSGRTRQHFAKSWEDLRGVTSSADAATLRASTSALFSTPGTGSQYEFERQTANANLLNPGYGGGGGAGAAYKSSFLTNESLWRQQQFGLNLARQGGNPTDRAEFMKALLLKSTQDSHFGRGGLDARRAQAAFASGGRGEANVLFFSGGNQQIADEARTLAPLLAKYGGDINKALQDPVLKNSDLYRQSQVQATSTYGDALITEHGTGARHVGYNAAQMGADAGAKVKSSPAVGAFITGVGEAAGAITGFVDALFTGKTLVNNKTVPGAGPGGGEGGGLGGEGGGLGTSKTSDILTIAKGVMLGNKMSGAGGGGGGGGGAGPGGLAGAVARNGWRGLGAGALGMGLVGSVGGLVLSDTMSGTGNLNAGAIFEEGLSGWDRLEKANDWSRAVMRNLGFPGSSGLADRGPLGAINSWLDRSPVGDFSRDLSNFVDNKASSAVGAVSSAAGAVSGAARGAWNAITGDPRPRAPQTGDGLPTGGHAGGENQNFQPDFHAKLHRMFNEARRDGINFTVTSGVRTHAEQEKMFYERWDRVPGKVPGAKKYKGSWWVHKRKAYSAVPGTSNHQRGYAVDIGVNGEGIEHHPEAEQWMRSNLPRLGLARPVKGEPWHIQPTHIPKGASSDWAEGGGGGASEHESEHSGPGGGGGGLGGMDMGRHTFFNLTDSTSSLVERLSAAPGFKIAGGGSGGGGLADAGVDGPGGPGGNFSGGIGQGQAYQLALDAGFTPGQARIMAAIAVGESGLRPGAFNPKGKDLSYGLWQINMLGAMGPDRRKSFGINDNKALFDPATNARAAKKIFDAQGFGAWSVYNSGKYKNWLGGESPATGDAPPQGASSGGGGGGMGNGGVVIGSRSVNVQSMTLQVKIDQVSEKEARRLAEMTMNYIKREAELASVGRS